MRPRLFWLGSTGAVCLTVVLAVLFLPGSGWIKMAALSLTRVTQPPANQIGIAPTPSSELNSTPQPSTQTSFDQLYPPCEKESGNYFGPLVPEPTNSTPIASSPEKEVEKIIPKGKYSDRAGFGISSSADPDYWAGMLGAGWYVDWSVKFVPSSNLPVHWQMVRVHVDCITPSVQDIRAAAEQFPGQVWIIGNEPDVTWQDNVGAGQYARIYHDLYGWIKNADPSASIAVGGVAAATPLRLKYLDTVLGEYTDLFGTPMPVDWWTIHGYVLREQQDSWGSGIPPGMNETQGQLYEISDHGRVDLFQEQLIAFRVWMRDQGYQDTPLALTEFGILMPASYGFSPEFVTSYVNETFQWLYDTKDSSIGFPTDQFRLVQKWAWFSLSDPIYSSADLGDLTVGRLTSAGESYRDFVKRSTP